MKHIFQLDQAQVRVRSQLANNVPVDVFTNLKECFGCPMKKYATLLTNNQNDLVFSTKYPFKLLFSDQAGATLCQLDDLDLSSQAGYELVVEANRSDEYNLCEIKKIQDGENPLFPVILVICIILFVTAIEKVSSIIPRNSNSNKETASGPSNFERSTSLCESSIGSRQVDEEEEAIERLDDALAEASRPNGGNSRIDSLDAFRGITITFMILVNQGGAGYSALEHKPWEGLTLADLVFPFFVFSMGASIAISSRSMVKRKKTLSDRLLKILRRSFILFALGICLNSKWIYGIGFKQLRITGVLQRFSISYFFVSIASTIGLTLRNWLYAQSVPRRPLLSRLVESSMEILTAINCLAIYLYFSFYFDYDENCPRGYLGPGGQTGGGLYLNCSGGAAGWIDRQLLGVDHIYNDRTLHQVYQTNVTVDPEGILGYTMSILLTLLGLQAGKVFVHLKEATARLFSLAKYTMVLVVASSASSLAVPINKHLWSLTFVTTTGCLSLVTLIVLFVCLDILKVERLFLTRLFISAGRNSILLYVGHSMLNDILPWYFEVDNLSRLQLFLRLIWSTFVWLLVARFLDIKKLYVKI